eukprot:GEMP01057867.1.p1 GENE.GEMP01057867.1~~GEMP01057867.1.p1  ORF type:complete len:146 (+),score=32.72 GEMP01057867.1:143-580(+)
MATDDEGEKSDVEVADEKAIVIAATFVAEQMEGPIMFWLDILQGEMMHGIDGHIGNAAVDECGRESLVGGISKVKFCALNQVVQSLLSVNGVLQSNQGGCNVLLIRLSDWVDVQERIVRDAEGWLLPNDAASTGPSQDADKVPTR